MKTPDSIHASRVRLRLDVSDGLSAGGVKARFEQAARRLTGGALAQAASVVPKDADLTIGRIALDLGPIKDGDMEDFQERLANGLRNGLRKVCTAQRAARAQAKPETDRNSAIGRDEADVLADFINLGIRAVFLRPSSFNAVLQAGAERTAVALSYKRDSAQMNQGALVVAASGPLWDNLPTASVADGVSPGRVSGSDRKAATHPDDPLPEAGAPDVHNPEIMLDPTQEGAAPDSKGLGTSGVAFRETGHALSGLTNSAEPSPHRARPEGVDQLTDLNDVEREIVRSGIPVETYGPHGQAGEAAGAQHPGAYSFQLGPTDLEHTLRWAAVILRSNALLGVLGAKRSSRAPEQSMPPLARDASLAPVASTPEVRDGGDDRLALSADEVRRDTRGIFPAAGLSEDAVSREVPTADETGQCSFKSDSRTDPRARLNSPVDPTARAPVDLHGSAEVQAQIRQDGALHLRAVLDVLIARPDLFMELRDPDIPIRSAVSRVIRGWQDGTLPRDAARELATLSRQGASDDLSRQGDLVTAQRLSGLQSTPSLSARLGRSDFEPVAAGPQPVPSPGIAYATEGAGLVLLWPFLGRFLDQAGVVSDGAMTGSDAAIRASHLIHSLSGRGHDREPDMLLARILAGLDLTVAIGPAPDLTDREIQLSEIVLDSLLAAWRLTGTSKPSLQDTFLDRAGTLTRSDASWRLQVDDGPFDVLMNRIDWPLSPVALPWMTLPIDVMWCT